MRKWLNLVLPKNVKIRTCYTGKRLSSCFKTKDRMKFDHKHDLIYHVKCPEEMCTDDYIGGSGRQVMKHVKDHNGRAKSSLMLRPSLENNHTEVTVNDFKVIEHNFKKNVRKRKVMEALLIKQFRMSKTLNVPEQ